MPNGPIDPPVEGKIALSGRIVTMDNQFTVYSHGVIYIDQGTIIAITNNHDPIPTGFETVIIINTEGTIFPGLIELHNHLSYNILPQWKIPQAFTNRDQWARSSEYHSNVTAPMTVIGQNPYLLPALVRFAEAKCLIAGVTTSQGIKLASNNGISRYYRGIVRNVEQTDASELPEATTRIADVEARQAGLFLERLKQSSCLLLHLSEGVDQKARDHFLALKINDSEWAIRKQLVGIHATALTAQDFGTMAAYGGGMVWSPFSNLLLYGATAQVRNAKAEGIRIGIGSDWSVSGSKNLLWELKVAKIFSDLQGGIFNDRELISLATCNAAQLLGWGKVLGSIEVGKKADLLVINQAHGDPYAELIAVKEPEIILVIINGIIRYGDPGLLDNLNIKGEPVYIGGLPKLIFLQQKTQDPALQDLPLGESQAILKKALQHLPELAKQNEDYFKPSSNVKLREHYWTLALDELYDNNVDFRHRLPSPDGTGYSGPDRFKLTLPLTETITPIELDALACSDDPLFLEKIRAQRNLDKVFKEGLSNYYDKSQ